MIDPKRAEQIRRKYQLKEKGISPSRTRSANCKYCEKEIRINGNTKVPVCKDPECQRRYAVYRVMLCRRRKREKEKAKEEN